MKLTFFRLFFCAFLACGATLGGWAQTTAGQIKAARIEGDVIKRDVNNKETKLNNGDLLTETDTVITADRSSVVLVFANASTVKVGANSQLKIEEFKMDPLAEGADLAAMTEEPSPSQTKLDLAYGEIVGDVKKLKGTSNYNIKTPVGAAGIRGTIYRIVFRPTGTGQAFNFQVTTAEGLVVFEGTTNTVPGGVQVPADTEIVVSVDVNTTTGVATISEPVTTATAAPPAALTEIKTTATQITQTLQETNFTPPPTTPPPTEAPKEEPKEQPKEEPKQEPPPPPQTTGTTQSQPQLTPGAGG